jgi:hypothetical protein
MAQANFNIRGLARPLALYCADGLVFFVPDSPEIADASAAADHRILAGW